ncbi:MAG: ABC transporter permease [Alphaproteobacteria bacterium]
MGNAAAVQGRVVHALILREISARFGQTYFGYIWALFNPAAGIIVLTLIFSVAERFSPPDIPLLMFVVTGYLTWQCFQNAYDKTQSATGASQALLHFPHVTGLDLVVARAMLEIMTYTAILGIFTAVGLLLTDNAWPDRPRLALVAFWYAGLGGTVLGAFVGALSPVMRSLNNFVSPVLRFGFFTSGIFFTATQLPSWVLPYLSWNPMFHVIERVRETWFAGYISPIAEEAFVLRLLLFGLAAALLAERVSRRWQGQ